MEFVSADISPVFEDQPATLESDWLVLEGDALEKLSAVDDASCKLVVTSPPYNIGKEYERDQRLSLREYLSWLDTIIARLCDKIASDGHICWQSGNFVHDGEVLRRLVRIGPEKSLFSFFKHDKKNLLAKGKSKETLKSYVDFCAKQINHFLKAVKENVDDERWTPDRRIKNRVLTVVYVNSFPNHAPKDH